MNPHRAHRLRCSTLAAAVVVIVAAVLSGVDGLQSGTRPHPVTAASLNNTMVYWLNGSTSTIKNVTSAGSGMATVPGVTADYRALATDGTYLYYSTNDNKIYRTPMAGGTSTLVATTAATVGNLFVSSTHVYYSAWSNGVYRVVKDGSGTPSQIVTQSNKNTAEGGTFSSNGFTGVFTTSSYLYFLTYGSSGGTSTSVFRANLDGSGVTRLYSAQAAGLSFNANELSVTSSKIYIANVAGYSGIISMDLDGSNPSSPFRGGISFQSIEIAGNYLYYSNSNSIGRFPLSDNTAIPTTLASGPDVGSAWDIALVDMPSVTYVDGGAFGGSVPTDSSSPYMSGGTVTVLGNTGSLTKTGYEFAGWELNQGGSISTPAVGSAFNVTTDATLTAQWTAGPLEFATSASGTAATSFVFPDTEIGSTSSLTVHVRNMGAAARPITSVSVPTGVGVTRTGGTCSVAGVPDIAAYAAGASPDNSCTYVFSWSPTSSSQALNAAFSVTSGTLSPGITLTGSALGVAHTPVFDSPVSTDDGFTVNVTNWDANWNWTPSASSGAVAVGAPSGTNLPLTVTGLASSTNATVTIIATRTGYSGGSATVSGSSSPSTSTSSISSSTTSTILSNSDATASASATTIPVSASSPTTVTATTIAPKTHNGAAAAASIPVTGTRNNTVGLYLLLAILGIAVLGSRAVLRRQ